MAIPLWDIPPMPGAPKSSKIGWNPWDQYQQALDIGMGQMASYSPTGYKPYKWKLSLWHLSIKRTTNSFSRLLHPKSCTMSQACAWL